MGVRHHRLPRCRRGLGTAGDFDALIRRTAGIKVIVDIVPNHTSDRHPWFQTRSRRRRIQWRETLHLPRRNRPRGEVPPSDWRSHFGGSAGEAGPDGQWYCHLFRANSPTSTGTTRGAGLLPRHLAILGDRGVDGFRVDMAHTLARIWRIRCAARRPRLAVARRRFRPAVRPRRSPPDLSRTGAGSSMSSTRRGWPSPKPGIRPTAAPICCRPRARSSVRLLLAEGAVESGQSSKLSSDGPSTNTGPSVGGSRGFCPATTSHDTPPVTDSRRTPISAPWLSGNGTHPPLDPLLGRQRARAATLMMSALFRGPRTSTKVRAGTPRGRRPDPRADPGPRLRTHRSRSQRPRRKIGTTPMDLPGHLLRIRQQRLMVAPAHLLRGGLRGGTAG